MDKTLFQRRIRTDGSHLLLFWCPGCRTHHGITVAGVSAPRNAPCWTFDGDFQCPTVSPSVRTKWEGGDEVRVCHLYIRQGRLVYLNDCNHDLAGQTVPMQEVRCD